MSSASVQPPAATPQKSNKVWLIVILVLLLVCCVCVVGAGGAAVYFYQSGDLQIEDELGVDVDELLEENLPDVSIEPQEESSPASSEDQEPVEQEAPDLLSNLFNVELGEEVSYPQCGYSFQKIPDFKFAEYGVKGESCNPAMLNIPPDAEEQLGDPIIMLFGETGESAQLTFNDVQKLIEEANKKDSSLLNQSTVKIGGKDAISIEQTIKSGEITIISRMVFLMVSPDQYFQISAKSTEVKYKELLPYFEAVLESVAFFEPEPLQK